MKFTSVFGIVIAIHAVVIGLLIFQPGCQTTGRPEPAVLDEPTHYSGSGAGQAADTDRRAAPPARPVGQASGIDAAFNAGFEPVTERPSGTREAARPTRPTADSWAEGVPVVSDVPRQKTYVVQRGDSLWKIANNHGIDLSTLLSANGLRRDAVIRPGQELIIPQDRETTAPAPATESVMEGRSVEVEGTSYTVQRGDTLSSIAARFGTTVQAIRSANNRRDDIIRVGETLLIPNYRGDRQAPPSTAKPGAMSDPSRERQGGSGHATHVVRAGENPTIIAERYGMKPADLIRMNDNLDPRRLTVGQVLLVQPAAGRTAIQQASERPAPVPLRAPEPIRVRVGDPPLPSYQQERDWERLLEDAEEIPVVPVDNADSRG